MKSLALDMSALWQEITVLTLTDVNIVKNTPRVHLANTCQQRKKLFSKVVFLQVLTLMTRDVICMTPQEQPVSNYFLILSCSSSTCSDVAYTISHLIVFSSVLV